MYTMTVGTPYTPYSLSVLEQPDLQVIVQGRRRTQHQASPPSILLVCVVRSTEYVRLGLSSEHRCTCLLRTEYPVCGAYLYAGRVDVPRFEVYAKVPWKGEYRLNFVIR